MEMQHNFFVGGIQFSCVQRRCC